MYCGVVSIEEVSANLDHRVSPMRKFLNTEVEIVIPGSRNVLRAELLIAVTDEYVQRSVVSQVATMGPAPAVPQAAIRQSAVTVLLVPGTPFSF